MLKFLTTPSSLRRTDCYYNDLFSSHGFYGHLLSLFWLQGLYDIVLGKQPSFCVVSNGAEVIMIDKDFYSENLNDHILKKIRNEVSRQ